MVHSRDEYDNAVEASQILFGNAAADSLSKLDKATFLAVFEGVPMFTVAREKLSAGINIIELLAAETAAFPNKSEVRRTIEGNGLALNKEKTYLLVQKGKKNYYIIEAV